MREFWQWIASFILSYVFFFYFFVGFYHNFHLRSFRCKEHMCWRHTLTCSCSQTKYRRSYRIVYFFVRKNRAWNTHVLLNVNNDDDDDDDGISMYLCVSFISGFYLYRLSSECRSLETISIHLYVVNSSLIRSFCMKFLFFERYVIDLSNKSLSLFPVCLFKQIYFDLFNRDTDQWNIYFKSFDNNGRCDNDKNTFFLNGWP